MCGGKMLGEITLQYCYIQCTLFGTTMNLVRNNNALSGEGYQSWASRSQNAIQTIVQPWNKPVPSSFSGNLLQHQIIKQSPQHFTAFLTKPVLHLQAQVAFCPHSPPLASRQATSSPRQGIPPLAQSLSRLKSGMQEDPLRYWPGKNEGP